MIGTWQNFALLAVGLWIRSGSAGQAKEETLAPTRQPDDPICTAAEEPRQ
ncbi:hypothetical protein FHT02_003943 [Sphingomonas xinjiangensis]|uniref:Uncharacterized protein n=1 Tax=Sphingomonas xinjiangensis TaxID=643568 RepID=A0A840YSQ6_9SPHN|nr:hypothetical protein [Sphingomonas xinjiangensis]